MRYKGFEITSCPDSGIERFTKDGVRQICEGYFCQIYLASDYDYSEELDNFCLAEGYEIIDLSDTALKKGIVSYIDSIIAELNARTEKTGLNSLTKLKAKFHCKDTEIDVKPCTVEKVIELNENDYSHFCQNLLEEYDFIKENADCMYQGTDNVRHCLLILGENHDDGILVDAQGYDYARYTAHLPNARNIARRLKYSSLNAFENEICSLTDKYTRKAVDGQIDCQYRIVFDEVRNLCRHNGFNEELFMDMLSDRDEINDVEYSDDGCTVTISEPYLRAEDEQSLRMLDPEEIEIMCAKHILWLHDAGGEQADFSNCLIKDWNLSGKNLINAVFDGAKFVNTNLRQASLCFSLFNGTRFQNCNLSDVIAEESEFKNAECIACAFDRAIFTHSDFTGTRFYDCTMKNGSLQNCCLDKTDFGNMEFGNVNTSGCSYDEQEWSAESSGENISM